MSFCKGRFPSSAKHLKKRLWLRDFRAVMSLPVSTDWRGPAASGLAAVLGNDQYGDCTIAGMLHLIYTWLANVAAMQGLPAPRVFTTDEATRLYFLLTGGPDNGLDLETVLKYFQQQGWVDAAGVTHKIGPYLAIDPTNPTELQEAIEGYGGVYAGVNLPSGWENNTSKWDVNAGYSVGGHCIAPNDYDPNGLYSSSWGMEIPTTYAGFAQYCDEAYVILSPDWDSPGKAPNGLDVAALQAALEAITNTPPSPEPPTPPAPPSPTPPSPQPHTHRGYAIAGKLIQLNTLNTEAVGNLLSQWERDTDEALKKETVLKV